MDLTALERFIVTAKRQTYVDGGTPAPSCRSGSHDLSWQEGSFRYLDSYFGGSDFIGQEVVWHDDEPLWAMNYYGYILDSGRIDAARAGATIKAALSAIYTEGRFLGGWTFDGPHGLYEDVSEGDVGHFSGYETISCGGEIAYRLDYHGGLIKA